LAARRENTLQFLEVIRKYFIKIRITVKSLYRAFSQGKSDYSGKQAVFLIEQGIDVTPRQAWQAALQQLSLEMPKAAFDTWVRDTELLTYEDSVFTIGAKNSDACDWVEDRLTSTVSKLLSGIMNNSSIVVHFEVQERDEKAWDVDDTDILETKWKTVKNNLRAGMGQADYSTWVNPAALLDINDNTIRIGLPSDNAIQWMNKHSKDRIIELFDEEGLHIKVEFCLINHHIDTPNSTQPLNDSDIILEAARNDLLNIFLRPDQVHVMEGYLLRWAIYDPSRFITLLAYRQGMYIATRKSPEENSPFSISIRRIAAICGLNKDTVQAHRDSWLLSWFMKRVPSSGYRINQEAGQIHKLPDSYVFLATTPLTPGDQDALQNWLLENGIKRDPVGTLKMAMETNPKDILPCPPPKPTPKQKDRKPTDQNRNFTALVMAVCPSDMDKTTLEEVLILSNQLRDQIISAFKLAFVSLYFLKNISSKVGGGAASIIMQCRQHSYDNQKTGEVRDHFLLAGGFDELSLISGVGVSTARSILPLLERSNSKHKAPGPKKSPRSTNTSDTQINRQRALKRDEKRALVSKIIYRIKRAESGGLVMWVRKNDPLTPEHEAEYNFTVKLIAWFIKEHPDGFGEAHIDELIDHLLKHNVFKVNEVFDATNNDVSDNKNNDIPDNRIDDISDNEIDDVSDNKNNDIPDNRIDDISDITEYRDFGQFKYCINHLTPKSLKNILLPLSNTNLNSDTPISFIETWPADTNGAVGWDEIIPFHEIQRVSENPQLSNLDLHHFVSHWIYVYSPEGEGINKPHAYVRSRLPGIHDKPHYRLAILGPRAITDLIKNSLPNQIGIADDTSLPGTSDWNRIMRGNLDPNKLLDLAERLGLLVYKTSESTES